MKRLNKFHLRGSHKPGDKTPPGIYFISSVQPGLTRFAPRCPGSETGYRSPLPSTMQQSLRGRMKTLTANPDIFALFLSRHESPSTASAFTASLRSSNSSDTTPESRNPDRAPAASCRLSQLRSRRNIPGTALPARRWTEFHASVMIFSPFSPRFSP